MDENMTEEIFALNNSIRNKSSEATQNIIAEMKIILKLLYQEPI
jgi:phosphate transport system protein